MPEQETMSIRIRLTADDYAEFNRYHGRWQMAFLFFFYWVIFVVIAAMNGGPNDAGRLAVIIPAGLLLSGVLIVIHLWSIKVKTRKRFWDDKLAQEEQQLELTETGIRHSTGETSLNAAWSDIYKAAETRNTIILYLARNKAIVIPKRDIDGEWPRLKQMLHGQLPTGKLHLKS